METREMDESFEKGRLAFEVGLWLNSFGDALVPDNPGDQYSTSREIEHPSLLLAILRSSFGVYCTSTPPP